MTFEKQKCNICHKIAYCVDPGSVLVTVKPGINWVCEFCFGWTREKADRKDTIRSIMIQCGIEDLEQDNL